MRNEAVQPKIDQTNKLHKIAKKAFLPTIVSAGILFPASIYANTDNIGNRSEEISNFLDNKQIKIAEGVVMAAGIALALNSHFTGKKWDENRLHALRVTGPVLASAASGVGLLDSQTTINFAIPAGLALGSTYAIATTIIVAAYETTTDKKILTTAIASGATIVGLGSTIFLAACDKL